MEEVNYRISGTAWITDTDGNEEMIKVVNDSIYATDEDEAIEKWKNISLEGDDVESVEVDFEATRSSAFAKGGYIDDKFENLVKEIDPEVGDLVLAKWRWGGEHKPIALKVKSIDYYEDYGTEIVGELQEVEGLHYWVSGSLDNPEDVTEVVLNHTQKYYPVSVVSLEDLAIYSVNGKTIKSMDIKEGHIKIVFTDDSKLIFHPSKTSKGEPSVDVRYEKDEDSSVWLYKKGGNVKLSEETKKVLKDIMAKSLEIKNDIEYADKSLYEKRFREGYGHGVFDVMLAIKKEYGIAIPYAKGGMVEYRVNFPIAEVDVKSEDGSYDLLNYILGKHNIEVNNSMDWHTKGYAEEDYDDSGDTTTWTIRLNLNDSPNPAKLVEELENMPTQIKNGVYGDYPTREYIDAIEEKYGINSQEYRAIGLPKNFDWKSADIISMADPHTLAEESEEWLLENGFDARKYGIAPSNKFGMNPYLLQDVVGLNDEGYYQLLFLYTKTPETIKVLRDLGIPNSYYSKGGMVKKSDFTMLGTGLLIGGLIAFFKK
jgi:hypothetical protein